MIKGRYLQHNDGSETPVNVFAIYSTPRQTPWSDSSGRRSYIGAEFAARCARLEQGEWTRTDSWFGTDRDKLWEWIAAHQRRKQSHWLFTHGAATQVDLWGFWELVESRKAVFWSKPGENGRDNKKGFTGKIAADASPFYLKFLLHGMVNNLVDICNYSHATLAEFGVSCGRLHPGEVDAELAGMFPPLHCDDNAGTIMAWVQRCIDYWRANDLGTWQGTPAKLALNAYRHFCRQASKQESRRAAVVGHVRAAAELPPRIVIHQEPELKKLERRAYFGGEAQAFRIGFIPGPVHYLDVRSMYPHIASIYRMPFAAEKVFPKCNALWLLAQLGCFGAIADVTIAGPWTEYPFRLSARPDTLYRPQGVPWEQIAGISGERVIYPEGLYRTHLCGLELQTALEMGHVREVHGGCLYRVGDLFSGFFAEWFARRGEFAAAGDSVGVDLCKIVMNGLIGKFGQRASAWSDQPDTPSPRPWGPWIGRDQETGKHAAYRSIGWHTQRREPLAEIAGSFIAIPAFVCSAARVVMRQLRRMLPHDSVILQDTDGLIVTSAGLEAASSLPTFGSTAMGGIRVKSEAPDMEVWGPRHYRFGGKMVLAGLHAPGVKPGQGSYDNLVTEYLYSRFTGLPHGEAVDRLVPFSAAPHYTGRMVGTAGRTSPLLVGIWE